MCAALHWWGWCFDFDIGGQRSRPPLTADGYPAWMPDVHAHAIALVAQGKDTLVEMVQARMRDRFRAEAQPVCSP